MASGPSVGIMVSVCSKYQRGMVPRHYDGADGPERHAPLETELPEKRIGAGLLRAAGASEK